ncbi:MAG TPA: PQQ-binding-like beta-propeller repeat protein [Gemmatimonadaceae bacterium]|nr:PQQ-binding-like beta-propeller repeat protein [Gemmatimonadaceae bacterium]
MYQRSDSRPRRVAARIVTIAALCGVAAATAGAQQAGGATYHVTRRVVTGGEGGWDYLTVDTAAHRLYLSRGTHVQVLDTDRDSVVGDIAGTAGVHGVAIARELGRGFTSNGRDSTVTVFDLKTLAPIATVKVTGRNPDAILYEPATRRVFTFNGGSANATAINAATGAVLGTIPIGGKPEFAVAVGDGRVFVNNEDKGEIVAFDARTLAVQAHWPMAGCEEPSGLAIDRAHGRLFAGCSNKVMAVVDTKSGRLVATVPIGEGVDANAFDPATQLAFASNGEGTITVVHEDTPDHYTVVATVPTQRGARTMAVDERTHRLYTVSAQFGPPPAPTPDRPRPRAPMVPGTFTVLVLER